MLERLGLEGITGYGSRVSLATVAAACPRLRVLAVGTACSERTDEGVAALTAGCPALQELSLSSPNATDRSLEILGAHCKHLRALTAKDCGMLTDAGVVALAVGCPQLEELSLEGCRRVTGAALPAIAFGCPRLRTLNLARTALGEIALATVGACHSLQQLTLAGCSAAATDASVSAVVLACPALTKLDVSFCKRLTDSFLARVALASRRLTSVDTTGCASINLRWHGLFRGPDLADVFAGVERQAYSARARLGVR